VQSVLNHAVAWVIAVPPREDGGDEPEERDG
jgi:hypothetical protein